MDNQREIVDIYFANKFALEFIICMMLYSIYHFPMCIPEVAGLLRVVNFLEETKYFVDCETIKNLITILYINIGEEDICRELGGHFQDAVTSLKL